MEICLVLVVMAMLCAGAAAQSSCTNVLVSLSPCLNYITGNSSTPSSGCCSQLASVVRSQPQCLCQVLSGGGSSLGLNINQTQALALPGACKVQTPPTSQCNNAAASPPTGTEAESPNSVPSGTGSKTLPTTGDGSSSGNSIKSSIPLLLILAATYVSTFTTYWSISCWLPSCYFFCLFAICPCLIMYYWVPLCWRVPSIHSWPLPTRLHSFVWWEIFVLFPLSIKRVVCYYDIYSYRTCILTSESKQNSSVALCSTMKGNHV